MKLRRHTVDVAEGKITYYPQAGPVPPRFVAYCGTFLHERCSRQRSAIAHDLDPTHPQGRPLGFLLAAPVAMDPSGTT